MKGRLLIPSVVLLAAGCATSNNPVEPAPAYRGMTRAEVVKRLGTPTNSRRLAATTNPRSGFGYPATVLNATAELDELSWTRGGHTLTVWFHEVNGEWVALDAQRVRDGVRF